MYSGANKLNNGFRWIIQNLPAPSSSFLNFDSTDAVVTFWSWTCWRNTLCNVSSLTVLAFNFSCSSFKHCFSFSRSSTLFVKRSTNEDSLATSSKSNDQTIFKIAIVSTFTIWLSRCVRSEIILLRRIVRWPLIQIFNQQIFASDMLVLWSS